MFASEGKYGRHRISAKNGGPRPLIKILRWFAQVIFSVGDGCRPFARLRKGGSESLKARAVFGGWGNKLVYVRRLVCRVASTENRLICPNFRRRPIERRAVEYIRYRARVARWPLAILDASSVLSLLVFVLLGTQRYIIFQCHRTNSPAADAALKIYYLLKAISKYGYAGKTNRDLSYYCVLENGKECRLFSDGELCFSLAGF